MMFLVLFTMKRKMPWIPERNEKGLALASIFINDRPVLDKFIKVTLFANRNFRILVNYSKEGIK